MIRDITATTTIHMAGEGSSDAGEYYPWFCDVSDASSISSKAGHVDITCPDVSWLFLGTWNYEWCISTHKGITESHKGLYLIAPSPNGNTAAVTCAPGPVWCPKGGGGGSVPTSTIMLVRKEVFEGRCLVLAY
ncbi:uncharacterized protein PAC_07477 [Phialocephala subalpina]|uniref:Uncharacterized protein n=1 Tax=Phialocephala subalpina TaxID=576137 RepID=A0A1L7WXV8_9HELO|nr:uncharacterized protein PAC_07477 [Phialocephala subalpina]